MSWGVLAFCEPQFACMRNSHKMSQRADSAKRFTDTNKDSVSFGIVSVHRLS